MFLMTSFDGFLDAEDDRDIAARQSLALGDRVRDLKSLRHFHPAFRDPGRLFLRRGRDRFCLFRFHRSAEIRSVEGEHSRSLELAFLGARDHASFPGCKVGGVRERRQVGELRGSLAFEDDVLRSRDHKCDAAGITLDSDGTFERVFGDDAQRFTGMEREGQREIRGRRNFVRSA